MVIESSINGYDIRTTPTGYNGNISWPKSLIKHKLCGLHISFSVHSSTCLYIPPKNKMSSLILSLVQVPTGVSFILQLTKVQNVNFLSWTVARGNTTMKTKQNKLKSSKEKQPYLINESSISRHKRDISPTKIKNHAQHYQLLLLRRDEPWKYKKLKYLKHGIFFFSFFFLWGGVFGKKKETCHTLISDSLISTYS